jgi:hypothetical protein
VGSLPSTVPPHWTLSPTIQQISDLHAKEGSVPESAQWEEDDEKVTYCTATMPPGVAAQCPIPLLSPTFLSISTYEFRSGILSDYPSIDCGWIREEQQDEQPLPASVSRDCC